MWAVKLGTSAVDAAKAATGNWVRITWKNATKSYDIQDAAKQHAEPKWTYADFGELIEAAFAGRVLDNPEQPEVKEILAKKATGK